MAKGKYSARAANRAASVDNDVIAQLREEVAGLRTENQALRHEISLQQTDFGSKVLAATEQRIAEERANLAEQHEALLDDMHELHRRVALELTAIMAQSIGAIVDKYGRDNAVVPRSLISNINSDDPSLVRLFALLGVKDQAGSLLEQIMDAGKVFLGQGDRRKRARRSVSRLESDLRANNTLHQKSRRAMIGELSRRSREQEA